MMDQLRRVLCRPVKDTPRTRQYQEWIDQSVDGVLERFDLERGLARTKGIDELPDETTPGYIDLPLEPRAKITSDEVADAPKA